MPANKPKASTSAIIAMSVVTGIIMLVVLIIVGRSFIKQIGHNGKVIGKKQDAQKQLGTNLANLPALEQAYRSLGDTSSLIADALPTSPDFPAFVATMEALAGASGVGLSSVSPAAATGSTAAPVASVTTSASGQATNTASPQPYGVSIAVKGNYAQMLVLLGNLQLSARPIVISGVQMAGTTNAITATITATTFYYNPEILADKTEAVK